MDPIQEIHNAAINPSTRRSGSHTPQQVAELKKRGICIHCGIAKTHKKAGILSGGGLRPLSDTEPCYQEHLCPPCYQKTMGDSSRRRSSNRSSSRSNGMDMSNLLQRLPDDGGGGNVRSSGGGGSWRNGSALYDDDDSSLASLQGSFVSNTTGFGSYTSGGGSLGSDGRQSTIGGGHYNLQHGQQQQPLSSNSSRYPRHAGSGSSLTSPQQQQQQQLQQQQRLSQCARISMLPESVWKVRADETLQEPRESLLFPRYESHRAARRCEIPILDAFDPTQTTTAQVHLVQLDSATHRPVVAYRRVSYPPSQKIAFGQQLFCTKLVHSKHASSNNSPSHGQNGFIEPSLREKWSSMVLVKEIEKQSYYGWDGQHDSPHKDAVVLQQIGNTHKSGGNNNGSSGVLKCTEILEDDHYIYLICPLPRYATLADCGVRHPQLRQNSSSTASLQQEEQSIKYVFRQLIKAVQHTHMHGVCHRNLDPKHILVLETEGSTNKKKTVILTDFCHSVLVPNTFEKRYLLAPGMSGGSNRRYMAPEVYHHQVYDGMAADLWSCGIILFELLTGCPLHAHPTRMDPMYCFFVLQSGLLMANYDSVVADLMDRMNNSSFGSLGSGSSHRSGRSGTSQQIQDLLDAIIAVQSLSQHAKHLLTDLLQEFPPDRLSIQEVLNHPWFSRGTTTTATKMTKSSKPTTNKKSTSRRNNNNNMCE